MVLAFKLRNMLKSMFENDIGCVGCINCSEMFLSHPTIESPLAVVEENGVGNTIYIWHLPLGRKSTYTAGSDSYREYELDEPC